MQYKNSVFRNRSAFVLFKCFALTDFKIRACSDLTAWVTLSQLMECQFVHVVLDAHPDCPGFICVFLIKSLTVKFSLKSTINRSRHIRCITQWHWLSLSFLYPYRIVVSLRIAYPNCSGNSTGLPSSAYITNRVRFCLFARESQSM